MQENSNALNYTISMQQIMKLLFCRCVYHSYWLELLGYRSILMIRILSKRMIKKLKRHRPCCQTHDFQAREINKIFRYC
jgi:hypothetical protein